MKQNLVIDALARPSGKFRLKDLMAVLGVAVLFCLKRH
jgi:hypothetical protein